MRVLMVTPRLPQAGRPATTAFISRQIASLKARRIDVDVMEVSEGTGLAYLKAAFRLHRRARASDLVHAHYGFCGWVARCQLSRPVVVSFLGSDLIDFPSRRRHTALRRRAEIEPDRVPMIMNACDAMVLTSLAEGSPNVVKEAMACNLPVVSVPVGDVELLLEGVLRCRVAPREPEALGATLAAVLDEAAPSDGRQALVHKGLDACAVAGRIVAVYEDVRAGRSLAAS